MPGRTQPWLRLVGLVALLSLVAVAGCIGSTDQDTALNDTHDRARPASAGVQVERPTTNWTWSDGPDALLSRSESGCAAGEDTLLIAGGWTGDGRPFPASTVLTRAVELYDAEEDQWSRAPDLPVPLHHPQVAHVDGTFYVLGGDTAGFTFQATNVSFSWQPGDPAWTPIEPVPAARGAGKAAVVGESIYLVGGYGAQGELMEAVHVYNTSSETWTEGPPVPTPREHLAVRGLGPFVVASHGRESGSFDTNLAVVEVLDTRTGKWTEGAKPPVARGGVGGAATPHGLVVAGGEGTNGTFEDVARYDPWNDTWSKLPPLPTPRHGGCVAWVGGAVHTVNGATEVEYGHSRVHEVLNPETDRAASNS